MLDNNQTLPLHKVVPLFQKGSIGVLPTDTVYGVAASAHNKEAVRRLYELKNRRRKPGTIIASSIEQLIALGVDKNHLDKVKHWWPNPLSVILPLQGKTATYLHQGVGDIAVRIVADDMIRLLLEQTGPLLTSSANQPGQPESTTIQEARNYFQDTVDFYVDGGDLTHRVASTIIRLQGDTIEVIRPGTITL